MVTLLIGMIFCISIIGTSLAESPPEEAPANILTGTTSTGLEWKFSFEDNMDSINNTLEISGNSLVKEVNKSDVSEILSEFRKSEKLTALLVERWGGAAVPLADSYLPLPVKILKIGKGIESIGESAFASDITSTTMGTDWLFLARVELSEDVRFVGARAFYYDRIGKLTVLSKDISIGSGAFANNSMRTLSFPGDVEFGRSCFSGSVYNGAGSSTLIAVEVLGNVKSIGVCAFFQCEGLESFTVNGTIGSIEDSAFAVCKSLEEITIPKETELHDNAFGSVDAYYYVFKYNQIKGTLFLKKIYGYKNSDAERVAELHGIEFVALTEEASISGEVYGVTWKFNQETGELIIDGSNEQSHSNTDLALTLIKDIKENFPDFSESKIKSIKVYNYKRSFGLTSYPYGSLEQYTMERFSNLESMEFFGSMAYFADSALQMSPTLKSLIFHGDVKGGFSVFTGSTALETIVFEGDVAISNVTFGDCTNIKSIIFSKADAKLYYNDSSFSFINESYAGRPMDTTVYGYSGSEAETFAQTYNLKFVDLATIDEAPDTEPNPSIDTPTDEEQPTTVPESNPEPNIETYIDNVPVPKGFEFVEGSAETGLVVRDGIGNEFVWVPVSDTSKLEKEEIKTIDSDNEAKNLAAAGSGAQSANEFLDEMKAEHSAMLASVEKYGGFYIGRYEAGALNKPVPVSKKGDGWNSLVSWYGAYNKSHAMYAENSSVSSGLLWAYQWEITVDWLNSTNPGYSSSGIGKGNFLSEAFDYFDGKVNKTKESGKVARVPCGNLESAKVNNIYDISGNVWEWTMEARGTNLRVNSGGGYNASAVNTSVSNKSAFVANSSQPDNIGFRVQFYINV
ncbi:MAG: leucine-rich repeat protein [Oscillospiraceae bacterium]|nr:leucine-rich repeat protein [Oscillospiraceae bacterium]